MVEKRMKKHDEICRDLLSPEFIGTKNYKYLVIAWGSNYSAIKEAVKDLKDTAFLCLRQLYPLHSDIKAYIIDAEELIIVENNHTSQLANLLKLNLGCEFRHKILKYDGNPFYVEELSRKISEVINENI